MKQRNIIILGGYGNFGKRIAENLLQQDGVQVVIAGRNLNKANALCRTLNTAEGKPSLRAACLDTTDRNFKSDLKALSPFLVIHTAGPFQNQDHRVPLTCVELGCHYIDLADDRRFVCDIRHLHAAATAKDVLITSGASSVPGLSSVVVDHFRDNFAQLHEIDFAIAPGNQAERGEATIEGVLSYIGRPIQTFQDGSWTNTMGWFDSKQRDFGGFVGKRWLANIDIPDLELFPGRYEHLQTVKFQAGLELPILHHGMSLMAWLTYKGLVNNWAPLAHWLAKAANLLAPFGTNQGGMQITMRGKDQQGRNKQIHWTLYADNGVGPYIPTIPAIILAEKLVNDSTILRGAHPCLGQFTLDEFDTIARRWGIYHQTSESPRTSQTAN